ncbi:MAG TPA: M28 family peptidase, partial [Acidobacteriota bacterium]|nr:M28 family peptidase [Acidobacteriota bacterium]
MACFKGIRPAFLLIGFLFISLLQAEDHLKIIKDLSALGPRVYDTEASRKAAEYIRNQLVTYGIQGVQFQEIPNARMAVNVVAVIPGKDPTKQIIIGSHHDSVPGAPGAYDDGGGTSVMLNVAKHFTSMQPPYTLVFCSFDGEEVRFNGSIAYAKSLTKEQRQRTLFMLCLEMMGWEKGSPNIQTLKYELRGRPTVEQFKGHGLLTPAPLTKLILSSARMANIPFSHGDPKISLLYQLGVRLTKVRFYGDDISFQLSGIPAVMFTDSSFSAFYPDYHQPGDVPQNLSESRLQEMTRLIVTIIHRAKAQDFGQSIDSKSQQEYLTIGPIFLTHDVMRLLYFVTLGILIWHLIARYGKNKWLVVILFEVLFMTNLFNHYATFAFVVFGLSVWMYLI